MTPEQTAKVFEPLFSTKGFGLGLGLAIVKQIMEHHGGRIHIDSRLGEGTRVLLCLPVSMREEELPTGTIRG
jgi:signal transduction histidine kinase